MAWLRSPARLAAAGLVVLALAAGALLLVPSEDAYIVLPDRVRPVEPVVSVEGGNAGSDEGGLYFVNVVVRKATLLERWVPAVRDGADIVPAHAINPAGVSETERRRSSLRDMSRSQEIAAAVALRELGRDVDIRENGALVEAVVPDRPAHGKIEAGDVLVAVESGRVRTPDELRAALRQHEPGDQVALRLRRSGVERTVRVTLAPDPRDASQPVIGVLVGQAADIELPVDVEIDSGGIGGPSAGLAFALGLLEELGRDVDGGRRVAVTGALDLDGDVLPVGGVKQKTIAVREAGIQTFLVPAGENAEVARRNADGVRVVPVRNFQQALRQLATGVD